MKPLVALLLLCSLLGLLPPAAGRAQVTPHAPGQLGPAVSVSVCQQVLADPAVAVAQATTPWRSYSTGWSVSTTQANSTPQALFLSSSGAAVGQEITVTTSLAELYGTLSYFYAGGSPTLTDELRVSLYEIGKINPSGLIITAAVLTGTDRIEGSWQTLSWDVADAVSLSRLRALGKATLVFSAVSAGTQNLWLDDLQANVCVAAPSLSGRVTADGTGLAGAQVLLAHSDAAGTTSVVARTRTGPAGTYQFLAVAPLAADERYRLWFVNQPETPPAPAGVLGFWAGPRVSTLATGQALDLPSFEVAGVTLLAPAAYAEVVASDTAPVVLGWSGRATHGERHRACLYDPERADSSTKLPVTYCSPLIDPSSSKLEFSLRPGDVPAAFGFTYGRSYRWYVEVFDRDPSDPEAQSGYSFYERAFTLLSAPLPEQPAVATPTPGEPVAGVPNADWTLLIYMAADNVIGVSQQAPSLGRPSTQLAGLPSLAAAYPTVNLVSYVDRYGPGGIELCAYPPGGASDCHMRAETNTADPQTLADFITYGRQRYPATHTALLIVAPGQAVGQLALDATAPGTPVLSLAGLNAAYQAASLGGATKLDLVIYQAPLLGSVEVLRTTAPYARKMVASAGLIWQLGPYAALVPVLGGASRNDLTAVADATVKAYTAVGGSQATPWGAYDLERAAALGEAVDALAASLQTALASNGTVARPAIAAARAAAQHYDSSGNGLLDALVTSDPQVQVPLAEDACVDLRDLAKNLTSATEVPTAVQQAATALVTLLDDPARTPIIATNQAAATLAIFFPGGDRFGGQATLAQSYYEAVPPARTPWAGMLWAYQANILAVGPGGVTEGANGMAQFRPLPGGFVASRMIYLYLPVVGR